LRSASIAVQVVCPSHGVHFFSSVSLNLFDWDQILLASRMLPFLLFYSYILISVFLCNEATNRAFTGGFTMLIKADKSVSSSVFCIAAVTQPLGPTQSPVQWVPGVLSSGVKRGRGVTVTTHPHLLQKSRMSRSYTSPPSAFVACSGDDLLFIVT
jgi:hypothetical protein